jgi:hypothetical protein
MYLPQGLHRAVQQQPDQVNSDCYGEQLLAVPLP